jgi:hypothetical protein
MATANTTTVIERPAAAAEQPRPDSSSGRIAWVEYIVANIEEAPRKSATAGRVTTR